MKKNKKKLKKVLTTTNTTNSYPTDILSRLPAEVIVEYIAYYLPLNEVVRLSKVNRRLRSVVHKGLFFYDHVDSLGFSTQYRLHYEPNLFKQIHTAEKSIFENEKQIKRISTNEAYRKRSRQIGYVLTTVGMLSMILYSFIYEAKTSQWTLSLIVTISGLLLTEIKNAEELEQRRNLVVKNEVTDNSIKTILNQHRN